ncbi:MAG: hypothetical protein R6U84_05780 [Candidatus Cloacimonadales bacterium]
MPNFIFKRNYSFLSIVVLVVFIAGCVGVANIDQRQGKLMQNCQEMLGKSQSEVVDYFQDQGLLDVVHEETLADGDKVIILEKKLVKNRSDRYIDRVMLVFREGKLAEYEIKVKD